MVGVSFMPFPKPKTNFERCKVYIKACGTKNFTINNITESTYVCSKNFRNGQPSELYPDPYPSQSSQILQKMQPKRFPPKQQTQISLKKPKLMVNDKEISSTLLQNRLVLSNEPSVHSNLIGPSFFLINKCSI